MYSRALANLLYAVSNLEIKHARLSVIKYLKSNDVSLWASHITLYAMDPNIVLNKTIHPIIIRLKNLYFQIIFLTQINTGYTRYDFFHTENGKK